MFYILCKYWWLKLLLKHLRALEIGWQLAPHSAMVFAPNQHDNTSLWDVSVRVPLYFCSLPVSCPFWLDLSGSKYRHGLTLTCHCGQTFYGFRWADIFVEPVDLSRSVYHRRIANVAFLKSSCICDLLLLIIISLYFFRFHATC